MELSYPSLEGINLAGTYSGPFILLKFLDKEYNGVVPKYPCGHKTNKVSIIRPPKVLIAHLRKRGVLADVGVTTDVVVFDRDRILMRVVGHRERSLCPQCFFAKILQNLDPVCPYCRKRIHDNDKVFLARYSDLGISQKKVTKALKVKHDGLSWALCCCAGKKSMPDIAKMYFWRSAERKLVSA